jgi:hypothetical protein
MVREITQQPLIASENLSNKNGSVKGLDGITPKGLDGIQPPKNPTLEHLLFTPLNKNIYSVECSTIIRQIYNPLFYRKLTKVDNGSGKDKSPHQTAGGGSGG